MATEENRQAFMHELVRAAKGVVDSWAEGDLAGAVRRLDIALQEVLPNEPIRVVVGVYGGLVQWVKKPNGVRVEVRDYDVEGSTDDDLKADDEGNEYFEGIW